MALKKGLIRLAILLILKGAQWRLSAAASDLDRYRIPTAVVMLNWEVGQVYPVAEALVALDGVAEVYSISGENDIMAIIPVKEYDPLAEVVSEKIAAISGITKTATHMAFRCYSKHDMEKMWAASIG